MRIIVIFYILSLTTGFSIQVRLESDNELQGLIFQPFEKIFIRSSNYFLKYSFNIAPIDFIDRNREALERVCPNNIPDFQHYDQTLLALNIVWNETKYETKGEETIFYESDKIKKLKNVTKTFRDDCYVLKQIVSDILDMHTHLNDIARGKWEALQFFIPLSYIKHNVLMVLDYYKDDFTTPYDEKMFGSEFWKYVRSNMQYENNLYTGHSISIEFDLPLFNLTSVDLFIVRPKPIVYSNRTYLYNGSLQYAIIDLKSPVLYSKDEYFQNCLRTEDKAQIFCEPIVLRESTCFNLVFSNGRQEFNSKCFMRLKKRNMVTQLGKNIYFTIFSPVNLWISKGSFGYPFRVIETSKIIEDIDYNISSTFFSFNTNAEGKYEIFFEKDESEKDLFFTFDFGESDFGRTFLIFILIHIALVSLICCRGQIFDLYLRIYGDHARNGGPYEEGTVFNAQISDTRV